MKSGCDVGTAERVEREAPEPFTSVDLILYTVAGKQVRSSD